LTVALLSTAGSQTVEADTSVCIIGGGIAGLLVALRLGTAGERVVVVESGLDEFDAAIHALNQVRTSSGGDHGATNGRFRGFGGSSSRWGGGLIPITRHEFGARPYLPLPEWPVPVSELEAYQPEIDRLLGLDGTSFEEGVLDTADPDRLFPRQDPDFTCRWLKAAQGRQRRLEAVKDTLKRLKNVHIWLGATVTGFGTDSNTGQLASVVAEDLGGRRLTIRAERFVVAAGSIETTRLLLLLNRRTNGRAFERCRVLGRYYQDHLDATVGQLRPIDRRRTSRLFGVRLASGARRKLHLELSPYAQVTDRVAGAYVHIESDIREHRSIRLLARAFEKRRPFVSPAEVGALMQDGRELARLAAWWVVRRQLLFPKATTLRVQVCVEQVPSWSNHISLSDEPDPLGVPKAHLTWRPGDADERTFQAVVTRLSTYWQRSGFATICPIDWARGVTDPSTRLIDMAEPWFHPSGTTRMGLDPKESVVDPHLRCHDVPNVWVVSASTFPSAGASNPTLTIMQLALRCADTLLTQARGITAASDSRSIGAL
jgi:choline dehydrogenase-like flavoprotein